MDYHIRRRSKKLLEKFTTSPMLPILGWTKMVESVVTASPHLLAWVAYAIVVTVVWVTGVVVAETVEEAVEDAAASLDD